MASSSSFEKSSNNVTRDTSPVNQDNVEQGQSPSALTAAESHHGTKKHLLRAAGIVGLMTLTSRILGMIRDIVSANRFGTSWQWDAFVYAFMLPNFFRRLVGEGALSSAFIPIYSETLQKHGKEAAFRFANVMNTAVACGLVVFLLAVEIVLKVLLQIDTFPARLVLTLELLQTLFPYLFFISLFALGMGLLNCHKHFFTPSLGPVILDIFWIVGVLVIAPIAGSLPESQLHYLAWILVLSGFVQFAVDVPPLYKMGFRYRFIWQAQNDLLKRTGKLLLPSIMSFGIVQINLLVDSTCGFLVGEGANSSLWYGNRLMQFPLGVFAIAMGTALLPTLSNQIAREEHDQAKKTISFALRSIFLLILPCTVGLIALSMPIVRLLFEHGEFDAASTARTSLVSICFSIGLFAYSGQKVMVSGFYARQDTKTPVRTGIFALVSNIILNLILMQFLREAGLALATSISGIMQFFILVYFYNKKVSAFPFQEVGQSFLRILLASLVMGAATLFSYSLLGRFFAGEELLAQLIQIFGSIGISIITYVLFCFVFHVSEMKEAVEYIRKRKVKNLK
jgi:putative peptidoglycan lipid II flippase